MAQSKFHGRFEETGQVCQAPYCEDAGEFRAPGNQRGGFDGPGTYRWFCLQHVREFNAGYDWFEGMSAEEVVAAQSPAAGWQTESPAFSATAGAEAGMPRWANFSDPLDAIGARAEGIKARARGRAAQAPRDYSAPRFTAEEAQALDVLGLDMETDRPKLRRRYSDLVRRYHPDRNGGDRQFEARLGRVVEAYQILRKSTVIVCPIVL
ncbi:MAG: J domain-containing protein, partial [Marinomonas sp.]